MFKTFPEFSKLTLADKEEYQKLISGYPPVADISFASLYDMVEYVRYLALSTVDKIPKHRRLF